MVVPVVLDTAVEVVVVVHPVLTAFPVLMVSEEVTVEEAMASVTMVA